MKAQKHILFLKYNFYKNDNLGLRKIVSIPKIENRFMIVFVPTVHTQVNTKFFLSFKTSQYAIIS